MKKTLLPLAAALAVAFLSRNWIQSAPLQTGGPPAARLTSFRIVFGEKQERAEDYSGSIALTEGKLVSLTPWRFFGSDAVVEPNQWKLAIKRMAFERQPDRSLPITTPGQQPQLVPSGVVITVDAPSTAIVRIATAQGPFNFRLVDLRNGHPLAFKEGDVIVQQAPTPQRVSGGVEGQHDYPSLAVARNGAVWVAWQSYQDRGDHVYARYSTSSGWSEPFRLTAEKGDVFETGVGEDSQGRIWVVWSQRSGEDWDLWARSYDGHQWDAARKLTSAGAPNIFHRLVTDRTGGLHLVWTAYRNGESHVMWSRQEGAAWSNPVEIGGPSAWAPDAASDSQGNLYAVWDSYANGNYDVFLRRIGRDGTLGQVQQVTKSPRFQADSSVAVDKQDRVWVAWNESGSNWGKDWSHEDSWRSTTLYSDRQIRVAVLDNGAWKQPAGDFMAAVPQRYNRYVEDPRLTVDAGGRVWMAFQIRTSSGMNRADYWAANGRWEQFLTSYEGDLWTPPIAVPESGSRPNGILRILPGASGVWTAWANDNRRFGGGGGFEGAPNRKAGQEIDAASFSLAGAAPQAVLEPFAETPGGAATLPTTEPRDVARMRGYRASVGGSELRILRGDFHRHTEISADGSGDGSVEDYFRYMLDAAQMDTGTITDHNAGGDDEYTWWRTEKAHDLFHIRGRFTPLFGYERSVNYPNGHRNIIFDHRGVRTLPVSREENQGAVNSGPLLYPYLKQNRGIGMLHSLATGQGSDYRDNDPEVEPLVELYQGYHAAYEYEGGPRAETPENEINIHGGFKPLGFYWNALRKGYKLGVQASSDHISTHTSYTLIYTPSVKREDVVESMRRRHVYGATDNIVLDFRADANHMMGDIFAASKSPKFQVKATGTSAIAKVEIIKDGKFVFHTEPNGPAAKFSYVDAAPGKGESWYYVRVTQLDGNLAWSSPIWVKYGGR